MRGFILVLICMFLVSGCAPQSYMINPGHQPVLNPEANKATLVIVRDQSYVATLQLSHYIDGKFIGSTKGHSYIVSRITPGHHYVVVAGGGKNFAVAHINFEPAKTYYLGQVAIYSGFTIGYRVSEYFPLTLQEASDSMKACTYMEYNPSIRKIEDMDTTAYKNAIDAYMEDVKANPNAYKKILEYQGY